ncbi:MAG: NAD(P)H-binding protein [Bacteroidales bacterium]|nr:NAD(P)H-binding protein [Bacteroidales bacterium]
MEAKTAIVVGATGLTGSLLIPELLKSGLYSGVRIISRRKTGISYPGTEEIISDFSSVNEFAGKMKGDHLYICTGTTIKKAGSVAEMEKIDRDLPVMVAKAALAGGVKRIAVVSSIGASSGSKNYYLRIKGEMEDELIKLEPEKLVIARPSMLLGDRKEFRAGEAVGKAVMKIVNPLLAGRLKKYRAIHGSDVGKAMIILIQGEPGMIIAGSDDLQKIASGRMSYSHDTLM